MGLRSFFDRMLGREQPPTLRNKPGGIAYVRSAPTGYGAEALNGQIVKTQRINERSTWTIEPELLFVATAPVRTSYGQLVPPGMPVGVSGIEDCFLEPLKGDDIRKEEVDQLYAPGPVLIPLQVKGEVH